MIRRARSALILSLPLLLLACGYPWYHYSFPLPESPISSSPWIQGQQNRLVAWKFRHHTSKLKLQGSKWTHLDTGLRAEFGTDGVFRWLTLVPDDPSPFAFYDYAGFEKKINGATYQFDPTRISVYGAIALAPDTNLKFPEIPAEAHLGYDGRTLHMWLYSEDGQCILQFKKVRD